MVFQRITEAFHNGIINQLSPVPEEKAISRVEPRRLHLSQRVFFDGSGLVHFIFSVVYLFISIEGFVKKWYSNPQGTTPTGSKRTGPVWRTPALNSARVIQHRVIAKGTCRILCSTGNKKQKTKSTW